MSRIKEQKRMYAEERIEYTKEDVRFGTPEIVARYRAERLSTGLKGSLKDSGSKTHNDCLIEIGCSVGFQTFPFAEAFRHVIAVEIDKRKIEIAKRNAAVLGLNNIDFVLGDALDKDAIEQIRDIITEKKLKVEAVFLDPERAESEQERTLETLKPNIIKFISAYSKFTGNIAIELPPYIERKKLKDLPMHELEYISLNNNLNRLTAYFGDLKTADVSLVVLPQGRKIVKVNAEKEEEKGKKGEGERKVIQLLTEISFEHKYFYEINPALLVADVLGEALLQSKVDATEVKAFEYNKKKYLLSNRLLDEELFVRYDILNITETDEDSIKAFLVKARVGKVILHGNIKQDEYFQLKDKFEKGLKGNKTLHIFLFDKCIICEKT